MKRKESILKTDPTFQDPRQLIPGGVGREMGRSRRDGVSGGDICQLALCYGIEDTDCRFRSMTWCERVFFLDIPPRTKDADHHIYI